MAEKDDNQKDGIDNVKKSADRKIKESTTASHETTSPEQWLKTSQKIYSLYIMAMKFLISTALFIAFIFLAYQSGKDMFSNKVVVQPFTVAPVMEKKGYTGNVIVSRLMNKMEEIRRRVRSENNPGVQMSPPGEGLDIEIPGVGVSLNALISYLRVFIGVPPLKVNGSVVVSGEQVHMIIDIPKKKSGHFVDGINNFDKILEEGAVYILKSIEPLTLGRHFYTERKWEALKALSLHIERNDPAPKEKAAALLIDGLVLFGQKENYEEALKRWEWSAGLDPENPAPLYHQGWALDELQRYDEAEAKYKKALELAPNFAVVYNSWGIMLFNMDKPLEAIEKFKKAVGLNTNYAKGYNNWGYILIELGQPIEAIEKFRKAIKIDPKNPDFHDSWGEALVRLERFEEGAKKFDQATNLDPTFDGAFFRAGKALLNVEGREQEGIDRIVKAITINPDKITYRVALGDALIAQGRIDKAIKAFEEAVKKAPEEALTNFKLGSTIHRYLEQQADKNSQKSEALLFLTKAEALDKKGEIGREAALLIREIKKTGS